MAVIFDVHCPTCGPFRHAHKSFATPNECPRCGEKQAIILAHDFQIDARFAEERESAVRR